jgi:hypothetical protein
LAEEGAGGWDKSTAYPEQFLKEHQYAPTGRSKQRLYEYRAIGSTGQSTGGSENRDATSQRFLKTPYS